MMFVRLLKLPTWGVSMSGKVQHGVKSAQTSHAPQDATKV
jgi:hypothetical protein